MNLPKPIRLSLKRWLLIGTGCLLYTNGIRQSFGADEGETRKSLRAAAEQGSPVAQRKLAEAISRDPFVPEKKQEARAWFEKAALSGDVDAMVELGDLLMPGESSSGEAANAIYWYRKAVQFGQTNLNSKIGWSYVRGQFGSGNSYFLREEGIFWLQTGAEKGDPLCDNQLGRMYCEGWPVARDLNEGLKWYRRSAELGNAEGQWQVGLLLEGRYRQEGKTTVPNYLAAIEWYKRAAKQGHPGACYSLSRLYQESRVQTSREEFLGWIRLSVGKQFYEAQVLMLKLVKDGVIHPQNANETSSAIYQDMERERHPVAHIPVALLYRLGEGVPADPIYASFLYARGLAYDRWDDENSELSKIMGLIDGQGNPRPNNDPSLAAFAREFALFVHAIGQNDHGDQFKIGNRYLQGDGLPRSNKMAQCWFRYAAGHGSPDAQKMADELAEKITPQELADAYEQAWLMDSLQRTLKRIRN